MLRDKPKRKDSLGAKQDHAAMVRDFINQEPVSNDPNYRHRVTADDGKDGEQHLRDFRIMRKPFQQYLQLRKVSRA